MTWFYFALISAVLSAASTITEKKVLFKTDAMDFVFWASVFNVLFSIPFFFGINYGALQSFNLVVLFIKSVLGALSFICVMYALKNLEISGALPLMVFTPALVAIFGFLFIGDALTWFQIGGIALLIVGTYLLEVRPNQKIYEPFLVFKGSKYYYYIGAAILLFTLTSVLDKLLLGKYKLPPVAFMAFQQLFYLGVISVIYAFNKFKSGKFEIIKEPSIWFWIAVVAILTIGYRYSQIMAVKNGPVAAVLAVKRTSVFMAAIFGGKLFKESSLLQKAIATAIMVAGAILIMED
jgi:uncharacterized membrane protein